MPLGEGILQRVKDNYCEEKRGRYQRKISLSDLQEEELEDTGIRKEDINL